jgi:mannose-6-phosphate isomerase-like protein (cupin superfamily)
VKQVGQAQPDERGGFTSEELLQGTLGRHHGPARLPVGGAFRHSDSFRTIFAADEVLYVLEGAMAISNPETGEVHRVGQGEAAFFRKDTWHHCFNTAPEPLRVLEFFAPPPSQGTSGAYAQTKPNLTDLNYGQERWLGRWPMAQEAALANQTIRVIRAGDRLCRLEGARQQLLVDILASTEQLTVGIGELQPGRESDVTVHGGDESLYVLKGNLNIRLPENEGQRWFELNPKDGFYIPEGTPHQYYNISGSPVSFIFGVAPDYGEGQDKGAVGR